MPVARPNDSIAEIHMLLCKRDLYVGLLAIRSLLRFHPPAWAVSLSDDGTLTAGDRRRVDQLIPGVRWISWPDAAAEVDRRLTMGDLTTDAPDRKSKTENRKSSTPRFPHLLALYHSRYAPVCKLLHATLLARCPRVIVLDPDTAFFQPPERLIAFATGQEPGPLYLHDHQDEAVTVPVEVQATFAELASAITPPGWSWRLGHRLFNSGLLAFAPAQMRLDLAEQYLAWREKLPEVLKMGKAAIWFGDWTPEQTCYHIMFALQDPAGPPAQPLGDDYHLGGQEGHVFNHFLRHYLVQRPVLRRLRRLAQELS